MDEARQRDVALGLRRGDPEAWRALYDAYARQIWRGVSRLIADAGDVADVVQETMLAAARSADGYDSRRGTLWQWLWGIACNQAALHRRRQVRRPEPSERPERWQAAAASPAEPLEAAELARQVRHALQQVDSDYSAMLLAKYVDGLSTDEIARQHGLSPSAASSKLARARKALARMLHHAGRELRSTDSNSSSNSSSSSPSPSRTSNTSRTRMTTRTREQDHGT